MPKEMLHNFLSYGASLRLARDHRQSRIFRSRYRSDRCPVRAPGSNATFDAAGDREASGCSRYLREDTAPVGSTRGIEERASSLLPRRDGKQGIDLRTNRFFVVGRRAGILAGLVWAAKANPSARRVRWRSDAFRGDPISLENS
jgi:hypothetical protein